MDISLSEALRDYEDESVALNACDELNLARVETRLMARFAPAPRRERKPRRVWRKLCLAAAAMLALSAAAFAAYHHFALEDAFIEPLRSALRENVREQQQLQEISLNGLADSPEAKAYVEWVSFQSQWLEHNEGWFENYGFGDDYFDALGEESLLYQAYAPAQQAKLEEIMERYDLAPHTARYDYTALNQLSQALGRADIFPASYANAEGYLYEDGSFCLRIDAEQGGPEASLVLFVAARGSFTMISNNLRAGYETWDYTTADGCAVTMVKNGGGSLNSLALMDLSGCFVSLSAGGEGVDKPFMEALVEDIDWAALGALYATETARAALKESVAAFAENPAWPQTELTAAQLESEAALALAQVQVPAMLGNYHPIALPEGYALKSEQIPPYPATIEFADGSAAQLYSVSRVYGLVQEDASDGDERRGDVCLDYELCRALPQGEREGENLNDRRFAALYAAAEANGEVISELQSVTAAGREGFRYVFNGVERNLVWLDSHRNLVFRLSAPAEDFTDEDLLALAASVDAAIE